VIKDLDIAVAGCGVAGMASALLLRRQGHRVTIFERFAAPKPVGSGLMIQPTGLAVLAQLGLAEQVVAAGAKVTRLLGKAEPSGRTALDVRYDWLPWPCCGYGIHRASLFDILYRAVEAAGIAVVGDRPVTGCEREGEGRRLGFSGGERSEPFDLVVDAMGAMSALAPHAARVLPFGALWASLDACDGFAPDILEQRYHRASWMCGVLPIGGGEVAFFWSLRCADLAAWREAGLAPWKEEVRALWPATAPLLDQITDAAQLTFARYAHRTLKRPAEAGLIHIGDAWHSTSPQLGQGANMALLDAWALAQSLAEAEALGRGLARAVRLRRGHVRLYQALSIMFTPAYQSDGRAMPFVRDRIVPPLAWLWPATRLQAEMVAGTFGGPMRRLGLKALDHPDRWP
jgi:salicylate hydroxylase